jgi:transcriptional regulator of nitric oxide reductase/ferredoxin
MIRVMFSILLASLMLATVTRSAPLDTAVLADKVVPPYQLGKRVKDSEVWTLVNLDGADAGYIFESEPLAPIPGFSGIPINMLIAMDKQGKLLNVEILHHNEPIFVSGLGEAPFHKFVTQYRGRSIYDAMSVGVPYGKVEGPSSQIYLDGVTKATASVRIAHESILAAANAVARRKMRGIAASPAPDVSYDESLDFDDLVEQGIARRFQVGNRQIQDLFEGGQWEFDDPVALADADGLYLDLWVVDIGPPSIARALLDADSLQQLEYFLSISPEDEPILLIDQGRHGLVSEDFVRNTEPDLIGAEQDGLPVALRDADLELALLPGLPQGHQIVLRTDRRIGFDPTRPWQLTLKAVRKHGSFMPTIGTHDLVFEYQAPDRFFATAEVGKPLSAPEAAIMGRLQDLYLIGAFLLVLTIVLATAQSWLAGLRGYRAARIAFLALMTVFVGWYGQGQLSVVTLLATLRALVSAQGLDFLLFDPFSLLIWCFVILSLVLWGRGFFCGWLCPYGAMQEISGYFAQKLGVPQLRIKRKLDRGLKKVKYLVLLVLVAMTFFAPAMLDRAIEVEPFKTAVTTYFVREWYFVAYAALWLLLGLIVFRGFCRYVCPLGAFLAIGGLLRLRNWIPRRQECGSRCQLCAVRCQYNAIEPSGKIGYDECFQCLDCVAIYDDANTCSPLLLRQKGKKLVQAPA